MHARARHARAALEDHRGQVGEDDVVVGQDDQLLAAHVQHVVFGVGLAQHMGVAVHDDALAALFHDGRLGHGHRDGIGFALAHGARRGDVVRVIVREVLDVLAFQPVDGLAGGIGAQHHEVAGPGVHFMGDAARRVHLDGPLRVIGRPPGAGDQHQQQEQRNQ
ncbi:hypothetical protein D3C72_1876030 [compost metagenome]